MRLHFKLIIGRVKLEDWCLYIWRQHVNARGGKIIWHDWDIVRFKPIAFIVLSWRALRHEWRQLQ